MTHSVLEALKNFDSNLFQNLNEEISEESLYRYLKNVADTHAPSQSTSWTRAAVIKNLLKKMGI